jgi:hypothetical protein
MLTKQMKIGPCEQVTDNIPIHFREKPTIRPNVTSCMLVARGAERAIST